MWENGNYKEIGIIRLARSPPPGTISVFSFSTCYSLVRTPRRIPKCTEEKSCSFPLFLIMCVRNNKIHPQIWRDMHFVQNKALPRCDILMSSTVLGSHHLWDAAQGNLILIFCERSCDLSGQLPAQTSRVGVHRALTWVIKHVFLTLQIGSSRVLILFFADGLGSTCLFVLRLFRLLRRILKTKVKGQVLMVLSRGV